MRSTLNKQLKFPILVLMILFLANLCLAQDAAQQISAATKDIEKQLTILKVPNDQVQQCTTDVNNARTYLKQGYLFLSLYTIRNCQIELSSLAYAQSKSQLTAKGPEAFEEEWRQLGTVLSEKEATLAAQSNRPVPAVVAALAEAAKIQARPYYQSGKLFALNSNMSEGIYYLGRAPANLDFAIFCRGLRFQKIKSPITYKSLTTELNKLETAALRTYKSADVTKEQAQYNRLNSNLKVAGELNTSSMFAGAFLKYLESELYFGLILTAAENEDLQHLQERCQEVGKLLMSGKQDHSIGLLFWQLADTELNQTESAAPTQAQIKRAVVVLNNVLPSYLDYMKDKQQ